MVLPAVAKSISINGQMTRGKKSNQIKSNVSMTLLMRPHSRTLRHSHRERFNLCLPLDHTSKKRKEAIQAQWAQGNKKTLLVLPTGTGKTIVFSKLIEDCVRQGERVLVLAHRGELLDQAADKLGKSTGLKCAVEKAEETHRELV